MDSLKLLDQAIDSLDAIDSACVRNEAEAQILNAFEGDTADLTEAETLATKYLSGAKRALALEILRAIDLNALRRAGLGNDAHDALRYSVHRLEDDGATWIDEASWVGDDLDEARRIAEMTGRGSHGSVIVDALEQTVDFGDRVEKLGGAA